MITLDGLQLPDGLLWTDEFDSSSVRQSVQYTLGGKQIIQHQVLKTNRKITLAGGNNYGFMLRSVLLQCRAFAGDNITHTLILHDARSFQVRWAYPNTISAQLIKLKHNPSSNDLYKNISLNLIIV